MIRIPLSGSAAEVPDKLTALEPPQMVLFNRLKLLSLSTSDLMLKELLLSKLAVVSPMILEFRMLLSRPAPLNNTEVEKVKPVAARVTSLMLKFSTSSNQAT